MQKKYLIGLISLIFLVSTVFAASGVTTQAPTANQVLTGGQSFLIDMNLTDSNAGLNTGSPDILRIYWSTVSGERQNLILYDANIQDASRVNCAKDYNLWTSTDCNYSWSVPGQETMPNGTYYLDYNFGVFDANKYTWYTSSSDRFTVSQPIAANACGIMNILPLILAAVLVIVILGAVVVRGGIDANTIITLAGLAVAAVIGIVILSSILVGVCV